jgi:ribonuclease-3
MAGSFAASIRAAASPTHSARPGGTGAPPGRTEGDLVRDIGHEFAQPALLDEALTHPSALMPAHRRGRHKEPARRGYQRLEFLGDRVLGLVVADLLWHRFEHEPEGLLTRRIGRLVCRETLAGIANALRLGPLLVLSPAEAAADAAANPAILADAMEALIAAIYLDGGFTAAADFVRRWWEPLIAAMERPPRDPKTALQEWAQGRRLPLPSYALVATSGPDHAPRFTVAASVAGAEPVAATASSKRAAETQAAALLLDRLAGECRRERQPIRTSAPPSSR